MPPWRQPFAITIHVYFSVTHVHMHVCMCMNVGACGDIPRHTHTHSLPPTHPSTRAGMAQIIKYAIKLTQIKIIQFCLKIWELYTFLHLFRLGLVCRWGGGVVPSQIAFFTFMPKKYMFFATVSPQVKIFQFSHWNLIDHVQLTIDMILDRLTHLQPFEITTKKKTKCKI